MSAAAAIMWIKFIEEMEQRIFYIIRASSNTIEIRPGSQNQNQRSFQFVIDPTLNGIVLNLKQYPYIKMNTRQPRKYK